MLQNKRFNAKHLRYLIYAFNVFLFNSLNGYEFMILTHLPFEILAAIFKPDSHHPFMFVSAYLQLTRVFSQRDPLQPTLDEISVKDWTIGEDDDALPVDFVVFKKT